MSGIYCRNKRKRTEWRLQKCYALRTSLTLFCAHGVALSNAGVFKITKAVGTNSACIVWLVASSIGEWQPHDPASLWHTVKSSMFLFGSI